MIMSVILQISFPEKLYVKTISVISVRSGSVVESIQAKTEDGQWRNISTLVPKKLFTLNHFSAGKILFPQHILSG